MNRNNLLGAAIITKNAEKTIKNTILSLSRYCSQIVVIDTGSTDRTPVICTNLGCEVHFFEWVNDFSIARNEAIKKMRTEWIISIDSDEILDSDLDLKLLENSELGGLNLKIINLLDENNPDLISEHRYTRIFRNHQNIKFSGKIHEQIRESIENLNYEVADTEIIIRHFGYSHNNDDKQTRNLELLQEELDNDSMNDFLIYHLANTEFSLKNFDKAKEYFIRIVNSFELSDEQLEMSKLRLAQISLHNDDIENIRKFTNFISNDDNREGFRQYLVSIGLILEGQLQIASNLINSDKISKSSFVDNKVLLQTKEYIKRRNEENIST